MFKAAVEMLITSLDNDGLNYFENFVTDFLGMSDISIKNFFGVEKKNETKERKKILILKFIIKAKTLIPSSDENFRRQQ